MSNEFTIPWAPSEHDAHETVRRLRPAALPGVELLELRCSNRLARVFSETYAFTIILDGRMQWSSREATRLSTAGTITLIEPGELVAIRELDEPLTCLALLIDPEVVATIASTAIGDTRPRLITATDTSSRLFRPLMEVHCTVRRHATPDETQSVLASALRDVLAEYAERPSSSAARAHGETGGGRLAVCAVRRAMHYLRAHVSEHVSLDVLAREACLSKYQLVREFARSSGVQRTAFREPTSRSRCLSPGSLDTQSRLDEMNRGSSLRTSAVSAVQLALPETPNHSACSGVIPESTGVLRGIPKNVS